MAPKFKLHTGKFYNPLDRHFVAHDGAIKNLHNEMTQYVAFSQLAEAELITMGDTQVIGNHLTISQAVHADHVVNGSGSNTITFNGVAVGTLVLTKTGSNTLTISQSIDDVEVYSRSNPQTLTITGAAVTHKIASRTLTDTLTLSQSVDVEYVQGSDWFRTIAGSGMIYWTKLLGQQFNFLCFADDGVTLYTGEVLYPSVSRMSDTLFTGGGVVEKKDHGRFIYTPAPDDIGRDEMSIIFANEGALTREIRVHPVMPPIFDTFESEVEVDLDSMRTTLGGLVWDQHGNTWRRGIAAKNPISPDGPGKKIATVDTQHANTYGCQVSFTLPDVDSLCMGVKIRAHSSDPNNTGFDVHVRTGVSGDSAPTVEIVKCDDGETVILSNSLSTFIRGQSCTLCARAIGTKVSYFLYYNDGSPHFYSGEVLSDSNLTYTRHGLLINKTDSDGTYSDYSLNDFRFVPYFEG